MGVTDDGIGDVAKEGLLRHAKPTAAYHYQVRADVLGKVDYRLVPSLAEFEMGNRDGTARLLDLPDLLVQELLSLLPDGFTPLLGL